MMHVHVHVMLMQVAVYETRLKSRCAERINGIVWKVLMFRGGVWVARQLTGGPPTKYLGRYCVDYLGTCRVHEPDDADLVGCSDWLNRATSRDVHTR